MRPLLAFLSAPFVALLLLAGPAGAQDDCYPSCSPPTTELTGSTTTTEPSAPTTTADPDSGVGSEEARAPTATGTGGGTLPITGGDLFAMVTLGLATMAVGGALMVASKLRKA